MTKNRRFRRRHRRHNPNQRLVAGRVIHPKQWLPELDAVQVQTHSGCNADCVFCPWIESAHKKNPGRMTDETWVLILDNLSAFSKSINSGKFCPYLMQEPLIDTTIFNKIADIYNYFPETCVEISTNGAALTEKTAAKLFSLFTGRRHELWVSHHGINPDTLQHIMRIDYAKTTNNLISALKVSDGRFKIKIRGAGESRDGKHIYFTREQYLQYWENLFNINGINRQNVEVDAFSFHDRAGTLYRIDRGANLLNHGTVREIDEKHPFYCPRLDRWIHFMWDGKIRLCCMDYHAEVDLPNIHDMSLLEYYHSSEYQNLFAQVTGAEPSPVNFICKRCTSPGG